jgi:hypothetical protein
MDTVKSLAFLLALLIALSSLTMLTVKPVTAQSIPKPSVPEFVVILADHSYEVPATTPTYTIDPFTGEQKQVSSGYASYHVENKSIEFTIKNQPFTPYNDSDGHYIGLYYNFRYKGHYGTSWWYDPFTPDGKSSKTYGGWDMTYLIPYTPSNSDYTIVSMPLDGLYGEVDFQVQAQIGYIQAEGNAFAARVWGIHYNFTGQSSEWSTTQTISLTNSSVSNSPNPSQSTPNQTTVLTPTLTPTAPDTNSDSTDSITLPLSTLAALIIGVVLLAVALSVLALRRRH